VFGRRDGRIACGLALCKDWHAALARMLPDHPFLLGPQAHHHVLGLLLKRVAAEKRQNHVEFHVVVAERIPLVFKNEGVCDEWFDMALPNEAFVAFHDLSYLRVAFHASDSLGWLKRGRSVWQHAPSDGARDVCSHCEHSSGM
jgi:hypothetical protein